MHQRPLPTADALLYYFAPPPAEGTTDSRLARLLAAIDPSHRPRRIVYISTSGVYGDCQGALVTEERPPQPLTPRARRRLDAEQTLLGWSEQHGCPVTILRVGGIYGPGRLPLERIRQGMPVLREEEAPPSNRIHADDLARICHCAAGRPGPSTIYNTSDGQHSTMTEYFLAVARAAGLPAPPQITLAEAREQLSPAMLSYLQESRRLDISKLRRELDYTFLYPTLEAGLKPE